jgi:hypothetical protein
MKAYASQSLGTRLHWLRIVTIEDIVVPDWIKELLQTDPER